MRSVLLQRSTRLLLSSLALSLAALPLTAQKGGGGKGGGKGGEPTEISRPVIISYPGWVGGGSAFRYEDPDPAWMSEILPRYEYFHPDQMKEDGGGRALVRAVSALGDLTHGGGTRFVVDVREACCGGSGPRAMISTVETVGTPENPTWYYDGPGGDDDVNDHVLLTDADYMLLRARWSPDGARIAFQATSVATGQSGVFVGDVLFDVIGDPDGLTNIVLVAADGEFPSWGGNQRIAFSRNADSYEGFLGFGGNGFVVDITNPAAPFEFLLGATTSPPELSSTGDRVVYSKDGGSRWDLFVLDLDSLVETQITDDARVPETEPSYATWSPDDMQILFSVNDSCNDDICRSLAIIDVVGSERRNTITKIFTVKSGKGKNGQVRIVGGAGSGIWRN